MTQPETSITDGTTHNAAARIPAVACFATQGSGSLDEARIVALLEPLSPRVLPFDRSRKRQSARKLFRDIRRQRPALVVMEGTGIAGGLAVLATRVLNGTPYVVSSGDAVGPYLGLSSRSLGVAGGIYERLLCRLSAGFIGWSPYLAGRALTLGAPRAMTAANWSADIPTGARESTRERLGIPPDAIVFGLVGSLAWNKRACYCYGLELVQAVREVDRAGVRVLIVGDGDGRERLERAAGDALGKTVILTGRIPRDDVPAYLEAMDVASLPQSVDGVGSFRYTTKLSEYLGAGLPVMTSRIPAAYDLDDGWLWRLPGKLPWGATYVSAIAELMRTLTPDDLAERRRHVPRESPLFQKARQQRQVAAFIQELLENVR